MSSQPTSQAAAATISLHNGWKSRTLLKTLWDVRGEELSCITAHPQEQLTLLQQSRNSVLNIKESSLKWGMPRDNAQNTIFFQQLSVFTPETSLEMFTVTRSPLKEPNIASKKTPSTGVSPSHPQTHPSQAQDAKSSLGFTGATNVVLN